jgi:hypothetical protein
MHESTVVPRLTTINTPAHVVVADLLWARRCVRWPPSAILLSRDRWPPRKIPCIPLALPLAPRRDGGAGEGYPLPDAGAGGVPGHALRMA